jgi:gamma-glutamylcyclotransferase (GGCT)/AIG2-like uncharacterized protein YtfP
MKKLYYFAYGSNLHPLRLQQRVPSACLLGVGMLRGYRLAFHKRSSDRSGKCNLIRTRRAKEAVYGALYEIHARHKPRLDMVEGNGYRQVPFTFKLRNKHKTCFAYIARTTHVDDELAPYDWYHRLVMAGARHVGVPGFYINHLKTWCPLADANPLRRYRHETLLDALNVTKGNGTGNAPDFVLRPMKKSL